jgi:hypothetical protein
MVMFSRLPSLAFAVVGGVAFGACTSGDSQTPAEGACEAIMDACHEKDDGTNAEVSACHEVAHEEDAAQCAAQQDACIATCDAAPPIGSGGEDVPATASGSTDDGATGPATGDTTGSDETATGTTAAADTSSDSGSSDAGSSTTGAGLEPSCDLLGSACHDIETKEGQMCHDIGHDGDEAACAKAWDACVRICGIGQ